MSRWFMSDTRPAALECVLLLRPVSTPCNGDALVIYHDKLTLAVTSRAVIKNNCEHSNLQTCKWENHPCPDKRKTTGNGQSHYRNNAKHYDRSAPTEGTIRTYLELECRISSALLRNHIQSDPTVLQVQPLRSSYGMLNHAQKPRNKMFECELHNYSY